MRRSSGKPRRRESGGKRPASRQRELLERRLSERECGRKRRNGSGEKGTGRSPHTEGYNAPLLSDWRLSAVGEEQPQVR
jgi:hypothetical protein